MKVISVNVCYFRLLQSEITLNVTTPGIPTYGHITFSFYIIYKNHYAPL